MTDEGLRISDLSVTFGGLVAVDHVTLAAPTGMVTGLIGPNGAGKTTTFNACTGTVPVSAGQVNFLGRQISHFSPARRAQAGLGRTFQRMELFDSMTVAENVALGAEAGLAGRRLWSHFVSSPAQRKEIVERTEFALSECGLEHLQTWRVRSLSTGHRRLVELARALASQFRFLLLDEPSSGLDRTETERFAEIISRSTGSGLGILLVEHDMALVREVCAYVHVLDFGKLIFAGTMAQVQDSEIVRRAYLGSEAA
ncbi:MAG TPA: ABC transporter ATP-binding protein [Acidimicrobiales bacterium]|jgi:ABC-type branched-subunit amino acid transport system ATPase component|nr:ABC transporter ATP-binding protein [Acidimicrobiales bacterium]